MKAPKIKIGLAVRKVVVAVYFFVMLLSSTTVYATNNIIESGPSTGAGASNATSTACQNNGVCATCEGRGSNCGTPCSTVGQTGLCAEPSCGQSSCDLVAKYVNPIIKLFSAVVGIVVVLSIIYGAIQYTASAGDPQKAAKARGHITKTVLALVVYIFFYAFLQFLLPGGVLHK